jgi:hypothetical protein
VSFAAITLCVASQRVFITVFISLLTQSGNFWIYPSKYRKADYDTMLPSFLCFLAFSNNYVGIKYYVQLNEK